jgi:hypothetical protein
MDIVDDIATCAETIVSAVDEDVTQMLTERVMRAETELKIYLLRHADERASAAAHAVAVYSSGLQELYNDFKSDITLFEAAERSNGFINSLKEIDALHAKKRVID